MTDEQLNELAKTFTSVMYDTGAAFKLPPADLAAVALLVAGNVNYSAHGFGAVEHMRNAADVFEQQLMAG